MATINGYTAEKMKAIADAAIKAVAVVGDRLIITREDDTQIDAGDVRGPQGDPGIEDMLLYSPVGVPQPRLIPGVPEGWGLCDGTTEYDADLAPTLATAWGTGPACVNGAAAVGNIKLPDLRGQTIFGLHPGIPAFDTLMETGGSKDAVVVSHDHGATADQPAHSHTADQAAHDHGGTTTTNGDHWHFANVANVVSSGNTNHFHSNNGYVAEGDNTAAVADAVPVNVSGAGDHYHFIPGSDPGISVSSADPAISVDVFHEGVSGVDKNLPPYRVANWIMRLA